MFRNIVVVMLIFLCASAYALDKDDMYKDWNDVVSLLRYRGVEASKINWSVIDPACQIIKNNLSEVEYNKCRFRKALDQNQYDSDASYCNAESVQKYFEYLKVTVVNGKKIAAPKLNKSEINDFKNSAYLQCMYNAGWNNPDSWVNGRKESFYQN